MNLPNGFNTDNGIEYGTYRNLPPGGYICRIVDAKEEISKAGNQMLNIAFDIAEGEYKDFYKEKFEKDTRSEKKWQGVFRQLTSGKSQPFFEGMIKSIQTSNGFKWDGDEKALKGKFFGGVFGEEEYINQTGNSAKVTKLVAIVSSKRIQENEFETPKPKLLDGGDKPEQKQVASYEPEDSSLEDEELPF